MKTKWIKSFNDENLILVLEKFDKHVHVELFNVMTVYYNTFESRTEFFLEDLKHNVDFDFDEIFLVVKEAFIKANFVIQDEIEVRDFIMDFMENNN